MLRPVLVLFISQIVVAVADAPTGVPTSTPSSHHSHPTQEKLMGMAYHDGVFVIVCGVLAIVCCSCVGCHHLFLWLDSYFTERQKRKLFPAPILPVPKTNYWEKMETGTYAFNSTLETVVEAHQQDEDDERNAHPGPATAKNENKKKRQCKHRTPRNEDDLCSAQDQRPSTSSSRTDSAYRGGYGCSLNVLPAIYDEEETQEGDDEDSNKKSSNYYNIIPVISNNKRKHSCEITEIETFNESRSGCGSETKDQRLNGKQNEDISVVADNYSESFDHAAFEAMLADESTFMAIDDDLEV